MMLESVSSRDSTDESAVTPVTEEASYKKYLEDNIYILKADKGFDKLENREKVARMKEEYTRNVNKGKEKWRALQDKLKTGCCVRAHRDDSASRTSNQYKISVNSKEKVGNKIQWHLTVTPDEKSVKRHGASYELLVERDNNGNNDRIIVVKASHGRPDTGCPEEVPKLCLSDIMWCVYNDVLKKSTSTIGRMLNYLNCSSRVAPMPTSALSQISHSTIRNPTTNRVMFMARHSLGEKDNQGYTKMKGTVTLCPNQDAFYAILNTPNGVGQYWLLHDRADVLCKTLDKIEIQDMSNINFIFTDSQPLPISP